MSLPDPQMIRVITDQVREELIFLLTSEKWGKTFDLFSSDSICLVQLIAHIPPPNQAAQQEEDKIDRSLNVSQSYETPFCCLVPQSNSERISSDPHDA